MGMVLVGAVVAVAIAYVAGYLHGKQTTAKAVLKGALEKKLGSRGE